MDPQTNVGQFCQGKTKGIIGGVERIVIIRPGYEQKNAFEHLSKFCKFPDKKATELLSDLEKLGKLKDRQKIAVLNFLPTNPDQLRMLFAHEIISLSEDEKKKIVNVVKKHV